MCREVEQRWHISAIQPPCTLPVPYQAHDRTGQVIGVIVVGKTQAQHVFQHADLLHLAFVHVLHFAPVLAIARGSLDLAVIEQAVVAIGLLQRQGQYHRGILHVTGKQLGQFQGRGQTIHLIGIDQGAVGHAQAQPCGLELAQSQGLLVKRHRRYTPGMHQ
ncbi:hypothetical protein D3C84_912820 [compost metagenome]